MTADGMVRATITLRDRITYTPAIVASIDIANSLYDFEHLEPDSVGCVRQALPPGRYHISVVRDRATVWHQEVEFSARSPHVLIDLPG